jgi:hypothetical protein
METSEFKDYFSKIPQLLNHFLGVFPIDKLPTRIRKKQFFVANLDPSYKEGSHWICFIRLHGIECEIFDSLGVQIDKIMPYIVFNQRLTFTFNSTPVQSLTSRLCGKFVVTFLIERMLNQTMDFNDLLEDIFSLKLDNNDAKVTEFCANLD